MTSKDTAVPGGRSLKLGEGLSATVVLGASQPCVSRVKKVELVGIGVPLGESIEPIDIKTFAR
jgi:hypothetical protein